MASLEKRGRSPLEEVILTRSEWQSTIGDGLRSSRYWKSLGRSERSPVNYTDFKTIINSKADYLLGRVQPSLLETVKEWLRPFDRKDEAWKDSRSGRDRWLLEVAVLLMSGAGEIDPDDVQLYLCEAAVLYALAGLKPQWDELEAAGRIKILGLPDRFNPEVRFPPLEDGDSGSDIDKIFVPNGRIDPYWSKMGQTIISELGEFYGEHYINPNGENRTHLFKAHQRRIFGKVICDGGSVTNMLGAVVGKKDTSRTVKFWDMMLIMSYGERIGERLRDDPDRDKLPETLGKKRSKEVDTVSVVTAPTTTLLQVPVYRMSSPELIVKVIAEARPKEVLVTGFEFVSETEDRDSAAWLSKVKGIKFLCLHPESSKVSLIAEDYGMSVDDMREYLRRNVRLIRKLLGNRPDTVRLSHALMLRAFYLDCGDEKRVSFVNDALIGECTCDRWFLAWPNTSMKERLKRARKLWQRGIDIVDYDSPNTADRRVDAGA